MNKPLSQRRVEEVRQVFEDHDIPLPQTDDKDGIPNKKELLAELARHGITNKTLKQFEDKPENKLDIEESKDASDKATVPTGDVVVCMTRRNPLYIWREYRFTSAKRFIPMSKEHADELIKSDDGFHIATREEIKRYYK